MVHNDGCCFSAGEHVLHWRRLTLVLNRQGDCLSEFQDKLATTKSQPREKCESYNDYGTRIEIGYQLVIFPIAVVDTHLSKPAVQTLAC